MPHFRITVSKNYRIGWTARIDKMPVSYRVYLPPRFFGFSRDQARKRADRWCKRSSEIQKKTTVFYTEGNDD